jgi:hypothetical protein
VTTTIAGHGFVGFPESPDASLWWESLRVAAVVVLTALAALSGGRRRG